MWECIMLWTITLFCNRVYTQPWKCYVEKNQSKNVNYVIANDSSNDERVDKPQPPPSQIMHKESEQTNKDISSSHFITKTTTTMTRPFWSSQWRQLIIMKKQRQEFLRSQVIWARFYLAVSQREAVVVVTTVLPPVFFFSAHSPASMHHWWSRWPKPVHPFTITRVH